MVDYLDFDLEIGVGRGRKYPLAVVRSPAGEARETMQFPFDELALEGQLLKLQVALLRSGGKRRQILSPDEQAVQNFGRALFEALFTREVRTRYALSQREAFHQGKGVRLKLRIQSPKLAALPWEFLYDAEQAEYICLSSNTPIVRYLELPQPPEPLSVRLPLRILGMIASPKDLADLDVEREKQRVEKALQHLQAKGTVELTWLPGQTWQDLQRIMRYGPWHIFHFIGHGGFDPNTDEGLIALKDDEGRAQYLSATHLGRLLVDHRTLRLVVLNSCEGARGSEKDIFSSTASILVRRGIPAVLAMQYEITDRAAIELSRAFYEALADSLPVDTAVSEARKAISLGVANTVEWGTPVLYMRSPDGILFDLTQKPAIQEEKPSLSVPSLLPIPPASLAPPRQAAPDKAVEPSAPVAPPSERSTAVPAASELFTVPSMPEAVSAPSAPVSLSTTGVPSSTQPVVLPKRYISRRAILVGLAGLAVAGSGLTWLALSQRPQALAPSPHPTAPPLGTTLVNYRGHSGAVTDLVWLPDDIRIASCSTDTTVQVWDAASGNTLLTYRGHSGTVWTVACSPDGKHIASAGGELNVNRGSHDHAVQVWDVTTQKLIFTYSGHSDAVLTMKWSPDGTRIASGSWDNTVQVWDAKTGRTFVTYRGHSSGVLDISWSPDNKRIVSGGDDKTIQVWDAATGTPIFTYPRQPRLVLQVEWSPDGTRIASSYRSMQSDAIVEVWDSSTGNLLLTYRGHSKQTQALSVSPVRDFFTSQAGKRAEYALLEPFRENDMLSGSGIGIYSVAWSPDSKRIASGGGVGDFNAQVWDASTGKTLVTYRGHYSYVKAIAWSSDGKRIASGSDDQTVQVWEAG